MLIAYVLFATLLGLFMSFIWSSSGGANVLIKTIWISFTGFSIFVLICLLQPIVAAGGMKLI